MREQDQHSRRRLDALRRGLDRLPAAVLFAIGCAAWASSANAGIYRGGFDPVAPALEGFVFIDLPDSCLNSAAGFNFLNAGTSAGDCGQVDVLSATVTSAPSPAPSPITFGGFPNVVTGLWWVNGTLEAITTTPFGPSTSPTSYFLGFETTPTNASSGPVTSLTSSVILYQQVCSCDDGEDFHLFSFVDESRCTLKKIGDPATQLGFVRVPEPGSLALLLVALGAGWVALRPRRA